MMRGRKPGILPGPNRVRTKLRFETYDVNADKAGFGEFTFNKKYDGYIKGGICLFIKKMHAWFMYSI